jgi:hypothetical protein
MTYSAKKQRGRQKNQTEADYENYSEYDKPNVSQKQQLYEKEYD